MGSTFAPTTSTFSAAVFFHERHRATAHAARVRNRAAALIARLRIGDRPIRQAREGNSAYPSRNEPTATEKYTAKTDFDKSIPEIFTTSFLPPSQPREASCDRKRLRPRIKPLALRAEKQLLGSCHAFACP
ncbi:MAG TPA: hypothetical protein PLV92_10405 [Pirellulaceae bacterium]|nr:hypothetical protein [Pirellulaceae bacterium]